MSKIIIHLFRTLLIILIFSGFSVAQNSGNFNKVWVLGISATFRSDFKLNPVNNSYYDTSVGYFFYGGHSSICDSFGNMQLLSDGMNLRSATGALIDNGDTLVPDKIYNLQGGYSGWAQATIILPLRDNKFIFIANSFSDYHFDNVVAPWNDVLVYSIVDMNANAGAGRVVRKRVTLLDNVQFSREQMTAVRHGNGEDWWLVKQGWDSNVVYKFLIKQDTILGPFIERYAEPYYGPNPLGGQSAFSRSGSRYASTRREAGKVFVGNFNRCTGTYSNPMVYNVPVLSAHNPSDASEMDGATESCVFSPNGRYLYVGGFFNIQQLDLQDNNPATQWSTVAGLDTSYSRFSLYSSLYLGPDDRLYISNFGTLTAEMSVITYPDRKGSLSSFCPKCMRFPRFYVSPTLIGAGVSGPPNQPNYALGPAVGPDCNSLGMEEVPLPDVNELLLYPNPSTGMITVQYALPAGKKASLQITDAMGRLIKEALLYSDKSSLQLNLESAPSGVYHYRYVVEGQQVQNGKLIILK